MNVYLALGVNLEGRKELLGMWIAALQAARRWTMPIQNWKAALSFFMIQFEGRLESVA